VEGAAVKGSAFSSVQVRQVCVLNGHEHTAPVRVFFFVSRLSMFVGELSAAERSKGRPGAVGLFIAG
jgi:hypothetical protein